MNVFASCNLLYSEGFYAIYINKYKTVNCIDLCDVTANIFILLHMYQSVSYQGSHRIFGPFWANIPLHVS